MKKKKKKREKKKKEEILFCCCLSRKNISSRLTQLQIPENVQFIKKHGSFFSFKKGGGKEEACTVTI